MTLPLGFDDTCAVKELELAQEEYVRGESGRSPNENENLAYVLHETVKRLNFRIRCMCRDVRCRWWDMGRCRCNNNVTCIHIGFEINRRDPQENQPTNGEIELAKSQISQDRLTQQSDEPFIVWKVRVAYEIWSVADNIHNTPEAGVIIYRYETWREENRDQRAQSFMRTIRDVRSLGTDGPRGDVTHVVGCMACGRIFENEDYLNGHVDLHRFRGETDHLTANVVRDTTLESVRPTSPDFRPSIPTTPTPPRGARVVRPNRRGVARVDHFYRDDGDDDETYRDRMNDYIEEVRNPSDRDSVACPDATGCLLCGDIFRNEDDYLTHAVDNHGLNIAELGDYEI